MTTDHLAVETYAGKHFILDVHNADPILLNDQAFIEKIMRDCVTVSGSTLLFIHLHPFDPQGITGVAILAESHISVHTWPEIQYAAFDLFMCGHCDPETCLPIFEQAFPGALFSITIIKRGKR